MFLLLLYANVTAEAEMKSEIKNYGKTFVSAAVNNIVKRNLVLDEKNLNEYRLKNSLLGFGIGSREMGDSKSAKGLLTCDIAGLSLMLVGGLGIAAADMEYKAMRAYAGNVTRGDYWIAGSVFGTGAIVFIAGRFAGYFLPEKFIINEKMNAELISDAKGIGIGFEVQF